MEVKAIRINNALLEPKESKITQGVRKNDFSHMLENALNRVNQLQVESESIKCFFQLEKWTTFMM